MFTPDQVKVFVKRMRKHLGDGWRFMTPEVRSAFVDREVLGIIQGQHGETVAISAIDQLRGAMHKEAGTD